ncbi:DUF2637 domain-containing protein [Frankia sp. R82]|uniref:DUF2637 domain-containing protein n=1 Tax=Frankia sp. R82 TaxID=2950553 RepID=UPI0020438BD1|nr:DUF2637 domain-containing protein [Frankia sp. R82]MCM3884156.1 DUF2637 domain-containing protein [Frankia sp. R82]
MLRTPETTDLAPVDPVERRVDADADVDRDFRRAKLQLEIEQLQQAAADEREAKLAAAAKAEKADKWAGRKAAVNGTLAAPVRYCRRSAAGAWSSIVYALAVGTAVYGQITIAVDLLHWPTPAGVAVAGFVEGLALSMALTAHELRMRGERALAPRVLTWVAAGFAAAVNGYAHRDDAVAAVLLAAASLAGITVWEIRTGARNRGELRALGIIAVPRPRLGLAYCVRFPVRAFWAWTATIAYPAIRTRAEAIDIGMGLRSVRRADRWKNFQQTAADDLLPVRSGETPGPEGPGGADDPVRMVADWSVPSGWVPDRTAITAGPDRAEADRTADERTEPRTGIADRSGEPVRTDWTPDRSADRTGPDGEVAADRSADQEVPVRTGLADRSASGAEDADRSAELRTEEASEDGPSADEMEPAVRDALPLVRPFAEVLWMRGDKINRETLRAEIRNAPEDRKIKIENGLLGKVSQILRAELPLPSPEESEATTR